MTWHIHMGGSIPCNPDSIVQVRFRGGTEGKWDHTAKNLRWSHRGDAFDVTEYRIMTEAREKAASGDVEAV